MVDRISLLLKAKNISASQFSDEIGVQRSSISHVLSGRNKPSLEFIQKILKRYPEINPDWILFGKGPMNMEYNLFSDLNEESIVVEAVTNVQEKKETLLRKERMEKAEPKPIEKALVKEVVPEETKIPEPIPAVTETRQPAVVEPPAQQAAIQNMNTPSKQIEKILVFYSDKTFTEYRPE